jgi:hypothetical protein
MTEDGVDSAGEHDGDGTSLAAPGERLAAKIGKLTHLLDSGQLASGLRRVMLVNAVHHQDRTLSADDA